MKHYLRGDGRRAGRRWSLAVLITLIAIVAACGGQTSTDEPGRTATTGAATEGAASTPTTAGPTATAAPTTAPTTTSGVVDPGPGESGTASLSGTGNATITIAGATVVFANFTCYYDDDAVAAFGDDDLTFGALGQEETADGTAVVAVSVIDSPFGPNYTIFYSPKGGSGQAWQLVGGDAAVIDGDRITGAGDFTRIEDGAQTDETDAGSFEASCVG